jgi:hypothetical protein
MVKAFMAFLEHQRGLGWHQVEEGDVLLRRHSNGTVASRTPEGSGMEIYVWELLYINSHCMQKILQGGIKSE